jgi:hypothetical protein
MENSMKNAGGVFVTIINIALLTNKIGQPNKFLAALFIKTISS